jgi:FkbM family methyltransferase
MHNVFRFINKFLYRVLSPSICTRLALSPIGRIITSLVVPKRDAIYECDFGIKLKLSFDEATVSGIAQMGCSNPLETDLLLKYLSLGDTFVDIGTFKDGWLALVGSRIVGEDGSIICFEPIPEHYQGFKQNVILNNRQNIVVEQLAVSDKNGKVTFSVAGSCSSFILENSGVNDVFVADTVALDNYFSSNAIKTVNFIKIDAEGAEPLIIKGAQKTLALTSYILVEVIDDFMIKAGTTTELFIESLVSLGFHPYVITRKNIKRWHSGIRSETLNMFFSKEKVDYR